MLVLALQLARLEQLIHQQLMVALSLLPRLAQVLVTMSLPMYLVP